MNYSNNESKRFRLKIYREKQNIPDLSSVFKELISNNVDVLIYRIPSQSINALTYLSNKGIPYLIADNLVYYSVDLSKITPHNLKNSEIIYEVADINSQKILDILVETIFSGYNNHYYSNPYFNKTDILDGYKEWARNNITANNSSNITFLIKRHNKYIGFACCGFDEKEMECEGILYGVVRSESGKGIYSDLIRYTQNHFKKSGFSKMKVSTQIQNIAVQKVWAREYFTLSESWVTVHINSLLNKTVVDKFEFDLNITEEEIKRFGELTGDFNKIHFSNEVAQSIGLSGKIAHGIIINSFITKFFGMEYPGTGTLFTQYSYVFFKPIFPNLAYKLIISFPFIDKNKGYLLSVAKVLNSNDELCLISYNHLLNKKKLNDSVQ